MSLFFILFSISLDNRASPSTKETLPLSSLPRDQLMEWNWSVEVVLSRQNGALMQFHPPVPSPAASPRKNNAVVVRRALWARIEKTQIK